MSVATSPRRFGPIAFVERRTRVQRVLLLIAVCAVFVVFSLRTIAKALLNMWWLRTVSDAHIWRTTMAAKLQLGLGALLLTAAAVALSAWWANRLGTAETSEPASRTLRWYEARMGPGHRWLVLWFPLLFGLWEATRVGGKWQVWMLFRYGRATGTQAPNLGGDVGDYLFRLPFWNLVTTWLIWTTMGAGAIALLVYLVNRQVSFRHFVSQSNQRAVAHLAVLAGAASWIKGIDFVLVQRPSLAMSRSGSFTGAGYTELNLQLNVLYALALMAAACGALFMANAFIRLRRPAVIAAVIWGLVGGIGFYLMPGIYQRFKVTPQEARIERPYAANNIKATRRAFALDQVVDRNLTNEPQGLESLHIPKVPGTATALPARLPLLDPNRFAATFQVLEGRTAVKITDVDMDRYEIDGKVRPVLLGARSSDRAGLPQQGWEQKHLVFTHGDGVAIAAADQVRGDGRPNFQTVARQLQPKHNELYFGENVDNWYVIVGTGRAQQNGATFDADTGIPIASPLRRAALALVQGELDPLVSNYIDADSQLLMRRGVRERISAMAPFLSVGSDPYPVIADGRIVWVVDAYTTSRTYPNSQFANTQGVADESGLNGKSFNYASASVKATVDAYDGTVHLYRTAEQGERDPIIAAWSRAYPGLFEPIDDMPVELREHLRYPVDLLQIQTQLLGRYHVTQPEKFLDGSRNWIVSADPGASVGGGSGSPKGPTTGIAAGPQLLDTGDGPRWVSTRPFNLGSASNANSPRAALSGFALADNDDSERLELWRVPSPDGTDTSKQIGGPSVVQAAINGDTELSQQFTLLSAGGSKVWFGGMTLVPNDRDILYVRPVYVTASGPDATQQLVEVLVFTDGLVGRGDSLDSAIANLRTPVSSVPVSPNATGGEPG